VVGAVELKAMAWQYRQGAVSQPSGAAVVSQGLIHSMPHAVCCLTGIINEIQDYSSVVVGGLRPAAD
jgi:hypothetical protein